MRKKASIWILMICLSLSIGIVQLYQGKYKKKEASKSFRAAPQDTRPLASDLSPEKRETWSGFQDYQKLKLLFEGLKIHSVIDLPSKDLEYLKQSPLKIGHYIGAVSSRDEADALSHRFGTAQTMFISYRVAVDPLPQADLLLAWDFFDGLSPKQVKAELIQLKKSGIKFVLMAYAPEIENNPKHPEGEVVPINWKLPPYGFPDPMIQLVSKKEGKTKILGLWSTEELP